MSTSDRLNTPGRERRWLPRVRMDAEVFGSFAEGFARFMGTASFLIWMTVLIVAWIAWNMIATGSWQVDPFPFIFLTLLLSLQASYAAPLILLAQNRQEARERPGEHSTDERQAEAFKFAGILVEARGRRGESVGIAQRDDVVAEARGELAEGFGAFATCA